MRILCFGDSNTWGYRPDTGDRYTKEERFTGILQKLLPEDEVIEEGMNGRTFVLEDPYCPYTNGLQALPFILKSQMPIDLVIIMLGTNDLKRHFHLSKEVIAKGAKEVIKGILNPYLNEKYAVAKILLVSPIHLHPYIAKIPISNIDYGDREVKESEGLALCLEAVAREYDCAFLDAACYACASEVDGMHMEQGEHEKLARALYEKIIEMK